MAARKLQVCAQDSERAVAAKVFPYQVATGWVRRLVRSWWRCDSGLREERGERPAAAVRMLPRIPIWTHVSCWSRLCRVCCEVSRGSSLSCSCGRYTTRTFIPVCGVLRCRVVSLTMQALCWFLCAICLPLLRVGSRAAPQAPSSTSVSSDTGSEMQLALRFCTPSPGLDTRAGIKPEVSHGFAGLGVCVVGW